MIADPVPTERENRPDGRLTYGQVCGISILPFADAWDLQKRLVQARLQNLIPDTLVLTQHEPVITLGRTAKDRHWTGHGAALEMRGISCVHLDRGGSATYHGPGQLVGYPILRLRRFCPGPKLYVHNLEEMLLRALREWDIPACRHDLHRGVWVHRPETGLKKIASIGVRIVRGVTMHGFALNVDMDLEPFALITPCGIEGCQVTSMAEQVPRSVDLDQVQEAILRHFSRIFGIQWQEFRESESMTGCIP